jgi:hypothetical protein
LSATPDKVWFHANFKNFYIEYSSNNSSFTKTYASTNTAVTSALLTLSNPQAYRYWRFTVDSTQAGATPTIYGLGLYDSYYQFDDPENPLFVAAKAESGGEMQTWNGTPYRFTQREVLDISVDVEYLPSANYATVLAWWRLYKNAAAIFPEPTSYTQEMYDVVPGELNLAWANKYKQYYAGNMTFRSY